MAIIRFVVTYDWFMTFSSLMSKYWIGGMLRRFSQHRKIQKQNKVLYFLLCTFLSIMKYHVSIVPEVVQRNFASCVGYIIWEIHIHVLHSITTAISLDGFLVLWFLQTGLTATMATFIQLLGCNKSTNSRLYAACMFCQSPSCAYRLGTKLQIEFTFPRSFNIQLFEGESCILSLTFHIPLIKNAPKTHFSLS